VSCPAGGLGGEEAPVVTAGVGGRPYGRRCGWCEGTHAASSPEEVGARLGARPSWSAESHVTGQIESPVRRQSSREPPRSTGRRSGAWGLRSLLSVRARRVRGGVRTGPVVGVSRLFSGGPCACHRLHRRHPHSGAVKPCPAGRCASPDGPGLDGSAGGRR
jgi:hypothetical protein